MSSLVDMLTGSLGGDMLGQLSKQLGTDDKTTGNAAGAAVSALVGALARNASQGGGAEALHSALAKDHDGSALDNASKLMSDPSSGPGAGILRHVLGAKQPAVEAGLGQATGLDSGAAAKLLQMVAPMVMGALGKQQRQQGMDAGSLAGFLGEQRSEIERREPAAMGMLGKLLDTDGDGDFDIGDAAKHGAGLLGKFFKK